MAYWDAEQSFVPPALLGEVSSTPAIRAVLRPGRNQPQVALDYQGLREPDELARFARAHMPDHVRRIEDEESWAALEAAASEERLARVAVFTDRAGGSPTPPLLKRLSAEFEARLLLAEVRPRAHARLGAPAGLKRRLPVARQHSIGPPGDSKGSGRAHAPRSAA